MTPDRLQECLEVLGWTQRGLAREICYDEQQVRRWLAGATIPDTVADWIEAIAKFHARFPFPCVP
jgi:ribosome-binding protein aMBF1 (putative translation factor)